MKNLFINTFATNLSKDRCAERATDADWKDAFEKLEKNLVTCPKCGKITFSEAGICFECGHPLRKRAVKTTVNSSAGSRTHKHKVIFKVLNRNGNKSTDKRELSAYVADEITGEQISEHLPKGALFKILYSKNIHKMGIQNLSANSWVIVHPDGSKKECASGQIQVLEKQMMIRIIPKIVQLNVVDIH